MIAHGSILPFPKCREEDPMGDAPRIIEALDMSREQLRELNRQWHLDPESGQIVPEIDPAELPETQPRSISVPRQTFD